MIDSRTSQPNSSKKKKFYLILFAGQPIVGGKPQPISVPQGLSDEPSTVSYEKKRADAETRKKLSRKGKGKRGLKGGEGAKEFVLRKKELYRQKGKEGVPRDSKCVPLLTAMSSVASALLTCPIRCCAQVHRPSTETSLLTRSFALSHLSLRIARSILLSSLRKPAIPSAFVLSANE